MKGRIKILIGLFFLFLLGIVLKVYKLNNVFLSGDDLLIPLQVIKYYPHNLSQILIFDNLSQTINPLGLFVIGHNILQMFIPLLLISIFKFLGLGITEITWKLPPIILGSAIIFPSYYLMKMFLKTKQALISAALVLFLPVYFSVSRVSFHDVLELFFIILTILLFCKYFTGDKKYAFWASLVLALYFIAGTFFPLIVILILYMGFVYNFSDSYSKAIQKTFKQLFRFKILFMPLLALVINLIIFFGTKIVIGRYGGVFGQVFATSGNKLSYLTFGLANYSNNFLKNFGLVLFLIIILTIFYSFTFLKKFRKESIFLVWFLIYTSPFLFFFHDPYYFTYITNGACAALLLIPLTLEDFIKKYKSYSWIRSLLWVVLALMILAAFGSAYSINIPKYFSASKTLGSFSEDNGAKTAGYWIRQNTDPSAKVFSDAFGGGGMEPWIIMYYCNREPIGLFDAELNEIRNLFLTKFENTTFFLITPINKKWAEANSPEPIFLNVIITSKGKEVLYIYSKKSQPLEIIPTEIYNKKFDKEYSKIVLMKDKFISTNLLIIPLTQYLHDLK